MLLKYLSWYLKVNKQTEFQAETKQECILKFNLLSSQTLPLKTKRESNCYICPQKNIFWQNLILYRKWFFSRHFDQLKFQNKKQDIWTYNLLFIAQ